MIALTMLLSLLAWAMLGMAVPKHAQAILKRPIGQSAMHILRWSGFSLLLLGFAVVVAGASRWSAWRSRSPVTGPSATATIS